MADNCRSGLRYFGYFGISIIGYLKFMSKVLSLLTPAINFVKLNFATIIVVLASGIVLYVGYWITSYSLRKLKPDVLSYYPFDKFFPKSGKWSVTYFIITIILLGALAFFVTKGGFYMGPA